MGKHAATRQRTSIEFNNDKNVNSNGNHGNNSRNNNIIRMIIIMIVRAPSLQSKHPLAHNDRATSRSQEAANVWELRKGGVPGKKSVSLNPCVLER